MARAIRIAVDLALASSRSMKPKIGIAWEYAKTEIAPPVIQGIVHGPTGKKFEDAVSGMADNFINGLQQKIKEMDAAEARKIKEKEEKLKAEQVKLKLEAELKKKEEEKLAKAKAEATKKKEVEQADKAKKEAVAKVKEGATKRKEAEQAHKVDKEPEKKKDK